MPEFISDQLPDPMALRDTKFDPTSGEVLGTAAENAWANLYTIRATNIFTESTKAREAVQNTGGPAIDPRTAGSDVDAMAAERGDGPDTTQVAPADATKQAQDKGAKLTPFTAPVSQHMLDGLIDDHLAEQKRQDVISRNTSLVSGAVSRFGVEALVSLADPLNIAAMMVPVAPEAWTAARLAAAGSGLGRAGVRAAVGGAQGAAGMAALEPLNYALDSDEHKDWSAGEALRNIAFGAALGAAGHAFFGAIGDRLNPETREAALRASIGQVMEGRPVDVEPILHPARAEANALERGAAPPANPVPEGITAYHGSPHSFDAFDAAHIGRGEGNQAFGHGFYFAESPTVAEGYRRNLARLDAGEVRDHNEAVAWLDQGRQGDVHERVRNLVKEALSDFEHFEKRVPSDKELSGYLKEGLEAGKGNVYDVRINAEREHLLDWDKPLSEQSPFVREALKSLEEEPGHLTGWTAIHKMPDPTGERIMDFVTRKGISQQEASETLRGLGIKGIRYLDAGSRDAGEGTHNIVVFDHNDVQITHKNGEPIAGEIARLHQQADVAAKDMAARANVQTPPEVVQAEKANAATVERAPKLETTDKATAEIEDMAKEFQARYDTEVASGRLKESPTLDEVGKDIEAEGKARADYLNCYLGRI